ncbi:MAG: hypothetical protein H7Y59_15600 [Anaerolineales bacterium]|nr:hypothetical protein [Anaerolineales bacterium]
MKTHPDISLNEHIQNLLEHLQNYFPELRENMFLYYDQEDLFQESAGWSIYRNRLMNKDGFEVFFNKLCSEGREWINLSGDSWYGNQFMISVEYSRRLNFPMIAILLGGPVLDIDHKPLNQTRLRVVE